MIKLNIFDLVSCLQETDENVHFTGNAPLASNTQSPRILGITRSSVAL